MAMEGVLVSKITVLGGTGALGAALVRRGRGGPGAGPGRAGGLGDAERRRREAGRRRLYRRRRPGLRRQRRGGGDRAGPAHRTGAEELARRPPGQFGGGRGPDL